MVNINIYQQDSLEFHKDNYNKKKDKLISEGIGDIIENNIEKAYILYETFFVLNELNKISENDSIIKNPIFKKKYVDIMYYHQNRKSNLFYKMKQFIKDDDGFIVTYCPFCQHEEASTLDHIIPKAGENGFPEYCDLPLNLIPMCTSCNKHKSDVWLDEENNTKYINLYLDKIPEVKFLRGEAFMKDGLPKVNVEFFGDNIEDENLKNKLQNTYEKFHITDELYSDSVAKLEITQLKEDIKNAKKRGETQEDIKKSVLLNTEDNNNYRYIIKRACVNSNEVLTYLYKNA